MAEDKTPDTVEPEAVTAVTEAEPQAEEPQVEKPQKPAKAEPKAKADQPKAAKADKAPESKAAKAAKAEKAPKADKAEEPDAPKGGTPAPPPRLKQRYREEIAPALLKEFSYDNVMRVPGLVKIVVNMGVGEAARDSKIMDSAVADLTLITGQKPQITKARKSIAQFKLREGMPIGCHVTLRGNRMWEFADRLLSLALPRIRDFRGLSPRQFDGQGNYTFGLTEQVVFHEINQDKIDKTRGMDITFVTTATTDEEGRALLRHLGFPFMTDEAAAAIAAAKAPRKRYTPVKKKR